MSAASKRAWRAANPERRRTYERERADRRRHGGKRVIETPLGPFTIREPGTTSPSYYAYEWGTGRTLSRTRARIEAKRIALSSIRACASAVLAAAHERMTQV
jgi:hypothetical protein